MISIPEDISSDDLYQWIGDGYVMIHGKAAVMVHGKEEDDTTCAKFEFLDNGREEWLDLDEVQCYWPVCGAINLTHDQKSIAVHVQREQRRQWRRTFNANCVVVTVPCGWGATKLLGRNAVRQLRRIGHRHVRELFNPTYPTPEGALHSIRSGALSVAISPQVIIAGDGKGQFAIYYRGRLVGGLKDSIFTPSFDGYAVDAALNQLGDICA